MPSVIPPPQAIRDFRTEADFERWLAQHHASATEIWVKIHKKHSGLPTVTYAEALGVALCWGWIDGIKKSFDALSFLQRFSPRQPRSIWSKINTQHIERLRMAKRMQPPGEAAVALAVKDGRWDNAYSGARDINMPDDMVQAIAANASAQAMFDVLTSQNRYALAFRLQQIKTSSTRTRRIAEYVAMLARGETIYPNKAVAKLPTMAAAEISVKPRVQGVMKGATKDSAKTAAHPTTKPADKRSVTSVSKRKTR